MLLDALITPKMAERYPWIMIIIGMFYTFLAILISYFIQKDNASILMVFLTVVACMPFVLRMIRYEENKDEKTDNEVFLLKEHSKALAVFMFLFIGMSLAFSIAKLTLPAETSSIVFKSQTDAINKINGHFTNNSSAFQRIVINNLGVVFICTIFSFLYGLGAIYILTWNASVLGNAIGDFLLSNIRNIANAGEIGILNYIHVFSCGYFFRYMIHGFLEILGFFTAGLAGGIICIAIVKHTFGTKRFANVVFDSADLLLISIVITIIAAFIEVWVTPGLCEYICTRAMCYPHI